MMSLPLDDVRTVLCVGAHCDDIEIGCGGTILRLLRRNPGVHVRWVVFSSDGRRAAEARSSAELFLAEAGTSAVSVEDFRGRYFPYVATAIKEYFDGLSTEIDPDVVFTHYRDDLHQDHRSLSELTYNTFRDHLVLEYEIPKYDGDIGRPSVYVSLETAECERKIEVIVSSFLSQDHKHWFSEETFRSIMRLRGIESKASSGYAEAFHCRKLALS
jgi:LmbE family N-acetylglucosaminyl deacetylase